MKCWCDKETAVGRICPCGHHVCQATQLGGNYVIISERKVNANRQNAQKSSGPKSADGKNRVSQNALKHGVYAQSKPLPSESQADHSEFINRLRDEFQPNGIMEEVLFGQLATNVLELMRLDRAYLVYLTQNINRQALLREYGEELAVSTPHPEPDDLDNTLTDMISDLDQISITDHVDRRKRRLLRTVQEVISQIRELQAHRCAAAVISPSRPYHDGDGPPQKLHQITPPENKLTPQQNRPVARPHEPFSGRMEKETGQRVQQEILPPNRWS